MLTASLLGRNCCSVNIFGLVTVALTVICDTFRLLF
jgi:hypothetical protein